MHAAPFEIFISPARARPQIWRLVLGLFVSLLVYFVGILAILSAVSLIFDFSNHPFEHLNPQRWSQPAFALTLLATFLAMALGPMVAVRLLHRRSVATLFGRGARVMRDFVLCAGIMLAIWLPLTLVWSFFDPPVPNLAFTLWLSLLPLTLGAIALQTLAEELVFRGYILQQLAARFKSPLVWLVLPAVLFGLGHYLPESAGSNAGTIALWATVFGMLMADLTARAGTLGPAIAVHFFNNVSAMVLISVPDEMSGLALFVLPFGISDEAQMAMWLPVDFGFMIVSWLAARLAIRA